MLAAVRTPAAPAPPAPLPDGAAVVAGVAGALVAAALVGGALLAGALLAGALVAPCVLGPEPALLPAGPGVVDAVGSPSPPHWLSSNSSSSAASTPRRASNHSGRRRRGSPATRTAPMREFGSFPYDDDNAVPRFESSVSRPGAGPERRVPLRRDGKPEAVGPESRVTEQ